MSGVNNLTAMLNVEAEFVRPRDIVAVRDARVASVDNTEEFYTVLRFDHVRSLRVPKVNIVTVFRKREGK